MLNHIGYIILNGRFEPSSSLIPPTYTYQREEGREATIIDYCLASIDEFQRIKTCMVIPNHVHNLPTDHTPVHLHLLIPRAPEGNEQLEDVEDNDQHAPCLQFHSSRLKDPEIKEQYTSRVEALSQASKPEMESLILKLTGEFISTEDFADAANHIIVTILHTAGETNPWPGLFRTQPPKENE
jgi:hypothetical protein